MLFTNTLQKTSHQVFFHPLWKDMRQAVINYAATNVTGRAACCFVFYYYYESFPQNLAAHLGITCLT